MIDDSRESKHKLESGLKKYLGSTFKLENFDGENNIKLKLDQACQGNFKQLSSSINLAENFSECVDKTDAMKK